MTSRLTTAFLVLLLMLSLVQAQSVPSVGGSGAAEQKKASEERHKKALALIDEIVKDTESLKLPENRIRIDLVLIELLWSRDEKRARAFFKQATASLSELTAAAESGDREYLNTPQLAAQLRQEMLQIAAKHDPRLALDFLRATRPAATPQRFASGQANQEAQLELRLALQIADKDPASALNIGEDSLNHGVDMQAMNLLYRLQTRDKTKAERFLGDVLTRLKSDGFTRNPGASYVALTLVRTWIESNRPPSGEPTQRSTTDLQLANLDEQTARDLTGLLIKAAMGGPQDNSIPPRFYPWQFSGILQQLKPLMPDIERLAPAQAGDLRKRIDEFDRFNEAQQGPWAEYQEIIQRGTAESLIEAVKTAPPEIADSLIQQAAWKAMNEGNADSANQIVERIADPRQRSEMRLNLERQTFYRAREQKKLAEARAILARLPSMEEQATLLAQMASSFVLEGDKATAIQLLGEAQGLMGDRGRSYGQLQALVQIAAGYESLDPGRSTAIIGSVIDQVNELAAAALVLNGFDVQQYFKGDEFVISNGNPLNMMANESARVLGLIAHNDLDGARSVAERFQRPELRAIVLLQIVQEALNDDGRQ